MCIVDLGTVCACGTRGGKGEEKAERICRTRATHAHAYTEPRTIYVLYRSDIALLLNSNVKNEKTLLNGGPLVNVRHRPHLFSFMSRNCEIRLDAVSPQKLTNIRDVHTTNCNRYWGDYTIFRGGRKRSLRYFFSIFLPRIYSLSYETSRINSAH